MSMIWAFLQKEYFVKPVDMNKLTNNNPMKSNLIAIEIFKGNPDADKIVKHYLDEGYTCLGAEEFKHCNLYWFYKE